MADHAPLPLMDDTAMDYDDDYDSFCCSSMEDADDDDSLSLNSFDEKMFQADDNTPCLHLPSSDSILRHLINSLNSNDDDFTIMELCVPIQDERDFASLLEGLRSNATVTECTVSSECFQSLSVCQRRELAHAICEMPSLKCLILDSVFPEFLYTCNYCRCWKRDHHYRQYQRYCEFENRTIEEIRVTDIPPDIAETLLGNMVLMTVSNFASLERLDLTFSNDFASPQAVLTRLALTALTYSKSLKDVKLGFEDDFGDYYLIMNVDTTRNENIMRVLKLRCGGDHLSERSYMELAQMLKMNSRTLKGLVLDTAVDNAGALTIANTLGQNSALKALCLGTFDCRDKTRRDGLLSLVSRVLCPPAPEPNTARRSSSLEYLSLVCQEMDDQGVEQISKAFSESQLRELMLFLDNEMDKSISSQGMAALARVFQVNKTIEELSLICHSLDDDNVMAFAKALKENSGTLKKLKLQCSKGLNVSSKGYKAIVDMLETNTTLESFEMSHCPGAEEDDDDDFFECESSEAAHLHYQPEIDFYLGLNTSGRAKILFGGATTKDWLDAIADQEDPAVVFYYLQKKPDLVNLSST